MKVSYRQGIRSKSLFFLKKKKPRVENAKVSFHNLNVLLFPIMSRFALAGQAEIIRAAQKDDQHVHQLKDDVSDIARHIGGIPFWIRWRRQLDVLAEAVYHSLTTAFGVQTLGEEYVNMIQVDPSLHNVPSLPRRIFYVFTHTFGKIFLQEVVSGFRNVGDNAEIHTVLDLLYRTHLVLFYLLGTYYYPAKRITRIRHLLIRKWLYNSSAQKGYWILGYLGALQLLITLLLKAKAMAAANTSQKVSNQLQRTSKYTCSLCMEPARESTVCPCGHLFCWCCITEWMKSKKECPLCRFSCEPQKLASLQN